LYARPLKEECIEQLLNSLELLQLFRGNDNNNNNDDNVNNDEERHLVAEEGMLDALNGSVLFSAEDFVSSPNGFVLRADAADFFPAPIL